MTNQRDDPNDRQSFAAFWAELQAERGHKTEYEDILGVQVPIPTTMPLAFAFQLEDLKASESLDDFASLVSDLFGPDIFDQLLGAGVDEEMMVVILGWGMAHAKGQKLTFREAYKLVNPDGQGNAQAANRQARRAAQRQPSGTGGGPSKPTSGGSTGSRRNRSRR